MKELIRNDIKRTEYMDCARAICTLWIVGFWHLFSYIGNNIVSPITSQITYGVLAAFTFISGYFLGTKEIRGIKDVLVFYIRRLISFYPLFFISCTLLWITGYIATIKQYVLTISGLAGIICPATITVWYLCMLMLFYFFTPILNAYREGVKIFFMFAFGIILVLLIRFKGIDVRWGFYWPFYCAGILYSGKKSFDNDVSYLSMLLSYCFFAYAFIISNPGNELEKISFVYAGSFIFFILNLGKIIAKTKILKIMMPISYASMSSYLFHRPFYYLTSRLVGMFSPFEAYLAILPTMLILCYGIQFIYNKFVKSKVIIKLEDF